MAKRIYCSDEDIRKFLESATQELKHTKLHSEDVKITFSAAQDNRKANLIFTAKAWVKMYALVHKYSTEVEWHGIVERKGKAKFLVKDILIFPHEVSGATVTSNQRCYEEWLDNLDDETFNACRFHGHSHVNMGVSPSGVDMGYRKNILNNFATPGDGDDYFYIFIITNKKGDISGEIYDLTNNALYGTQEITISVTEIDEVKNRIKDAFHDAIEEYIDKLTYKNLTSVNSKGELSFTIASDVEIAEDEFLSELISEAEGVVTERNNTYVMPATSRNYPLNSAHDGRYYGGQSYSSLQSKRPGLKEEDDEDDIESARQLSLYDEYDNGEDDYYELYKQGCLK